MKSLIRAYVMQRVQYYSESGERMALISAMHPRYAANAAEKMLREADRWAKDAGQDTDRPMLWLIGTPLFGALSARAGY